MKKKKTWMKFRHRVVRNLAFLIIAPITKLKYGITVRPFLEQNGRQYLIVMNHQTGFDQFFVGMAFKGPVYYLASEDLFSLGFLSTLLRWAVAPIPIQKQTTDIAAVKTCIRVAREGGTIALAPEGNRTFHGCPVHMNPAIAKLARKLGLPIAIFRIEGGYGIQPRWSDVTRKGKMQAGVSHVIEPEEYASMTDDELFAAIRDGLDVREDTVTGQFHHPRLAEYLERAMYVCPDCGLSTFHSEGDVIQCTKCGLSVRHLPTKELIGVEKPFPFRFVADWYDYQCRFVNDLNTGAYTEAPIYEETAQLSEVLVYKRKQKQKDAAKICLYGDRITIDDDVFPFADLSAVTVLGKNKVNLYFGKKLYQLKGGPRFNGLKYVNLYHRYKNITKGNEHDKFLGL